jgi:hypothetical protein
MSVRAGEVAFELFHGWHEAFTPGNERALHTSRAPNTGHARSDRQGARD